MTFCVLELWLERNHIADRMTKSDRRLILRLMTKQMAVASLYAHHYWCVALVL
jgi:hypothetical protein